MLVIPGNGHDNLNSHPGMEETVCISCSPNILRKGMPPTISPCIHW